MACEHFPDLPDEIANCMLCKPRSQVVGRKQATTSAAPGIFRRHTGIRVNTRVEADGWLHEECGDFDDPRKVEAQYPGRCVACGLDIIEGELIVPNAPLEGR